MEPEPWPERLSRDQARATKEKEKTFRGALKARAKAAGWLSADGTIFRQRNDCFASALPSLLWRRGVTVMPMAKPMALDPLFWSIVGLPENETLPLSFRANGAWVLRMPSPNIHVGLDESDPEKLADAVLAWADAWLDEVAAKSLESLISEVERLGPLRGHFLALEVCLHLLRGDHARALSIIQVQRADESGGFVTGESTFLDQAERWIATQAHRT